VTMTAGPAETTLQAMPCPKSALTRFSSRGPLQRRAAHHISGRQRVFCPSRRLRHASGSPDAGDDPVNEGDPSGDNSAANARGRGGPSCLTIQKAFGGTSYPTTSLETLELNSDGCLGAGGSEGFHLGGWDTFLVAVGVVAGVVAFASGVGELAAAGYVAEDGGDAVFLGLSTATWGSASSAAGLVATVSDIPVCGQTLFRQSSSVGDKVLACVGAFANAAGLGVAVKAGELTPGALPAIQGVMKALALAGGTGTSAWDLLDSLAADINSTPTETTTTTPRRYAAGLITC
jgi:hypothetical protein